jgi:CheY-like chemotaxis protein
MATDKLTILMIDDDPEDIAIVRGLLERVPVWSVELAACVDVKSAVQQVRQRNPDLILLDFNFGVASGLEVLPAIQSSGYNGPIILLSGCGRNEVASMVTAGLSDFLSKSALSSLTLYHAITLAMEKRHVPSQKSNEGTTQTGSSSRSASSTPSSQTRVRFQ